MKFGQSLISRSALWLVSWISVFVTWVAVGWTELAKEAPGFRSHLAPTSATLPGLAIIRERTRPLWLICCLLPVLLGADLPEEAIQRLRVGLQLFRDSQFAEAETAFAEASEIAPESFVIIFDEACAARANGDAEQARGLFLKAAQSREPELSVKSHYNLGCLEADLAREKLGDDPDAAEGDIRTESINQLLTAVGHYRDVLRFQPQHPDARHNLELIRLFIKHIQSEWAERDKQKARDEKDLLQFLKMIEDRETELRSVTRILSQEDSSASQRKLLRETANSQSTLREEIEPLKQKITEQIQQSQQQQQSSAAGTAQTPSPDQQQAEQLLHQLADMAGQAMLQASTSLTASDFAAAEDAQAETLGHLNQMYMAIAPYQNILQRSIQEQSPLVPAEVADDDAATGEQVEEPDQPPETTSLEPVELNESAASPEIDFPAVQETQSRITDWSRMLSLKAEAELPQMQQQLAAVEEQAGADTENPSAPADNPTDPEAKEPNAAEPELTEEQQAAQDQQQQLQQQVKQLQGLAKSMELAIQLGPDAEEHSQAAVQALTAKDSLAATPEQQETLRILKEIAEPLVKDPQDQNDQQQQDEDQKNDDQQQDPQRNEDQNKDSSKQEKPEAKDEPKNEPKDEQQQKKSEQEQQQESQQQQTESILRQARDRERQYRELQKERNAILLRGIKVDKDW